MCNSRAQFVFQWLSRPEIVQGELLVSNVVLSDSSVEKSRPCPAASATAGVATAGSGSSTYEMSRIAPRLRSCELAGRNTRAAGAMDLMALLLMAVYESFPTFLR